ncbi:ABC transporter substrate-binding protein [Yinghuangia aomiensis]
MPRIAPGVTDTTIKIGIAYPDYEAIKAYVKIDPLPTEDIYNALIKKINDSGGINGRKIVPVYGKLNMISPASAQETCVKLTEDEDVFAVLGAFNTDQPLCYVQTHETALIGGPLPKKTYALAQAPWFSELQGGDELDKGVGLLAANGQLAGKRVAVMSNVADQAQMKDHVIPALQALGITPVETGVLDAPAQDAAAVAQQMGVFIQKFQSSNVDTVLSVGYVSGVLLPALEKSKFRPRLMLTEPLAAATFLRSPGQHDLAMFNGAAAVGFDIPWNDPGTQECVATVSAAIPTIKDKLVDPDSVPADKPAPDDSPRTACRNLALFKAIAEKAGRDLNYETFQNAGFTLGTFDLPTYTAPATYTRDTPNGAVPQQFFVFDPALRTFVLPKS